MALCRQERIDGHTEAPTLAALLTLMIKRFLQSPDGTPPSDEVVDEILALRCMEREDLLTEVLTEDVAELMCDDTDLATIKDSHVSAAPKLPSHLNVKW